MNTLSEVNPKERTVHAVSIDFDGAYSRLTSPCSTLKELVENNAMLYLACIEKTEQVGQLITMTGSNRQSLEIDYTNLYLKKLHGSCFDAFRYFTYILGEGATFDTMTASDVIRHLPLGSTIERYLEQADLYKKELLGENPADEETDYILTLADATKLHENPNIQDLFNPEANDQFIDKNKIMLLYLQMHRIASQFPAKKIVFSFFDDEKEIYKALSLFFNKYKEWIPHNLQLDLYEYSAQTIDKAYQEVEEGEHPPLEKLPHESIQGIGLIDYDYANSFLMIRQLIKDKIVSTLGEKPDPAKLEKKLKSPMKASEHLTETEVKQIVMKTEGLQSGSTANEHTFFKVKKVMASAADKQPSPTPSFSTADGVDN